VDTPDEAVQEALSELQDSLKHAIHYLTGILDEGIDFISQLSSLAELDLEIV
jgi:hypothetical protein